VAITRSVVCSGLHADPEGVVSSTVRHQVIRIDDVISIEADVPQITFDFTSGGLYGPVGQKITTKEQADQSLPYPLAVALLDGTVMPAQFAPDRINRADV
jgi:2-methylcitrate dehydratase